jgi:hypothetical protein
VDSPILRLRQGLHAHFGPGAAVFVDVFLWQVGLVAVDIIRLDSWLQQRNPDYIDGDSMRLFIRRKFGEKAELFVEYWIKGESRSQDVQPASLKTGQHL